MFGRLIRFVPPGIIGIMVAKKRTLVAEERNAQEAFLTSLLGHRIRQHKTENPIVVALVGLVGSGKSETAQALAERIGATVIENDQIRIELRRQKATSYNRAWAIAENIAVEIVGRGGNVILDSDFVDERKRASLREKTRKAGVRLVFVRTVCDFDVMSQRIREDDPGDFFNSAGSKSTPLRLAAGYERWPALGEQAKLLRPSHRLSLIGDITFDHFPIPPLTDSGQVETITPELTAPQFFA